MLSDGPARRHDDGDYENGLTLPVGRSSPPATSASAEASLGQSDFQTTNRTFVTPSPSQFPLLAV